MRTDNLIKITNLIDEISEEMFRQIFEPFGRLDSVELIDGLQYRFLLFSRPIFSANF